MKKAILLAIVLLALTRTACPADGPYIPSDAERARWTLFDMRSWKLAIAAYKQDHGSYPAARTLEEVRAAVEPAYIAKAPMVDAWGRPYRYELTRSGFRLVSAGADGKFDPSTWDWQGQLSSLDADAVVTEQGQFWTRSWQMK
jgi:Type II secretion system (T2SS), protein G